MYTRLNIPALPVRLPVFDFICHFYGAGCSFRTFVPGLGACTLDCLLDIFSGDDAEHDGDTCSEPRLGNALGGLIADIVIMRRTAADDTAE